MRKTPNTTHANIRARLERWTLQGVNASTDLQLWTDGSCVRNPGPGGYAALLIDGDSCKRITGHLSESTNNRLELTAVIRGLSASTPSRTVTVFTDSTYVLQGEAVVASRRLPKANRDLWSELMQWLPSAPPRSHGPMSGRTAALPTTNTLTSWPNEPLE